MFARFDPRDGEVNPLDLLVRFGWTQQELADRLEYSISSVAKWSCGLRRPSRRAMRDAAKLLSNLQEQGDK